MARIVVVGSVSRDEVVRLAEPLRPGAHLEARSVTARLGGGAANTGLPLAAAGHHVVLVGPVGDDEDGSQLIAELQDGGVDVSQLLRVRSASTHSIVLVDPVGERTVVNVHRAAEPEPPWRLREIHADAIYVRSRATDLAPLLAEACARTLVIAHVPPIADGARPAHVLVGSATDLPDDVLRDPWAVGRRIAGPTLRWVVITRGPNGATAYDATTSHHEPAARIDPVDTTGAGDAFAAGLLHALTTGVAMPGALACAVAWGSACAGHDESVLSPNAVERLVLATG